MSQTSLEEVEESSVCEIYCVDLGLTLGRTVSCPTPAGLCDDNSVCPGVENSPLDQM